MDLKAIYRDGRHYDLQFQNNLEDVPFFTSLVLTNPGPILDLGCGTGRLTIPLAKTGLDVTGLDLMPPMLEQAKLNAARAQVNINWVLGDMTAFSFESKFEWILLPFNSIQHLHSASQVRSMLECVRKHLSPTGRFVFDADNPHYPDMTKEFGELKPVAEFDDPDGNGRVKIECRHAYDANEQMLRHQLIFTTANDRKIEDLNLKCFTQSEHESLLRESGFKVLDVFGSFSRERYLSNSRSIIMIATPTE